MKQIILTLALHFLSLYCCGQGPGSAKEPKPGIYQKRMKAYLEMITEPELRAALYYVSGDQFEGRASGSDGNNAAANYIASEYASMGIPPFEMSDETQPLSSYFQSFSYERQGQSGTTQNVIAFIEGSDPQLRKEIIVLSAHYDHLGRKNNADGDQIFNGAADDGSGTVALLELAESFISAKRNGHGPKRSLLFAHFSAEEKGVRGSYYFTTISPMFPMDRVYANINLDGVGGRDLQNPAGPGDYVYLLSVDSISAPMRERAQATNALMNQGLRIDKPWNPERFQSDNNSFEQLLIPSLYFSTGLTEHYHKVTDEAKTVDYPHMLKITNLVFATVWDLGNSIIPVLGSQRQVYKPTSEFYCRPCNCPHDGTVFFHPGSCPSCEMNLYVRWKEK